MNARRRAIDGPRSRVRRHADPRSSRTAVAQAWRRGLTAPARSSQEPVAGDGERGRQDDRAGVQQDPRRVDDPQAGRHGHLDQRPSAARHGQRRPWSGARAPPATPGPPTPRRDLPAAPPSRQARHSCRPPARRRDATAWPPARGPRRRGRSRGRSRRRRRRAPPGTPGQWAPAQDPRAPAGAASHPARGSASTGSGPSRCRARWRSAGARRPSSCAAPAGPRHTARRARGRSPDPGRAGR